MKKFIEEFKTFAFKGNVLDMAIGIVIGAAFGKIVSSFVADIITPLISLITKGAPLKEMFVVLGDTNGQRFTTAALAVEAGFATLNYGLFLQNILDFFIIALSVFIAIKFINTGREKVENGIRRKGRSKIETVEVIDTPTTKECPFCTSDINIKASRCPHCTSILEENKDIDT